jgi:integrase
MQHVGQALIQFAGNKAPQDLNIEDVRRAFNSWGHLARTTVYKRATLMRRMLKDLREEHGIIPRLWHAVPRVKQAPPRDVTIAEEERRRLLAHARPHMQLMILLCSDLAIRSGTASKLAPQHYDRQTKALTFTTKYDARMCLPVTRRIEALIDECLDRGDPLTPFVHTLNPRGHVHTHNLRAAFKRLCKKAGIHRRIILHDLRRTTAVRVLDLTKDVRQVQAALGHSNLLSTMHYLDHRMVAVSRDLLESASHLPTETIQ